MDPSRWQRIGELFAHTADMPRGERRRALDRLCRPDEGALRREVERLIAADDADEFLARPLADLRASVPGDLPVAPANLRTIGRYRLLRTLWDGPTSAVFLAARGGDYERRVAIKVLKPVGDASLVRRFELERRTLARLEHPSIARLYDAGTAADGRLYLVLEYVEGEPITDYCRRRELPIELRLRLFVRVCDAVQFAHQHLLVHRDLKPGNILVTPAGEPKLLDFGIVKPLEPDDALGDPFTTAVGQRPMTLAYASPEQARGEAVSTLSDVYSLGVLLFELVTGLLPYEAEGRRELERAVSEGRVLAPSAAVQGASRTDDCGLSPREHARRLAGDLDTIVLAALDADSGRRYATAAELADELERHLAHRPIEARRDALVYLARKYLRRNRRRLAWAAGAVALVAGFWLAASWQADRLSRSRSTELADLLVGRLAAAQTGDAALVPRQALDAALYESATHYFYEPRSLATVLETFGRLYHRAGLDDSASDLLAESLAIRSELFGEESPETGGSLALLGSVAAARDAPREAAARLRQAVRVRRPLSGGQRVWLAESLEQLAALSARQGDSGKAESLRREALEIRERVCPRSAGTSRALSDLGALLLAAGRTGEAEALYADAARRRERLGAGHPEAARTEEDRAALLLARGEANAAEEAYRRALERQLAILGPGHPAVERLADGLGRAVVARAAGQEAVGTMARSSG